MEESPGGGDLEGAPGVSAEGVFWWESLKGVTFSDSPGRCPRVWLIRGGPLDWAALRGSCGGVPWRGSAGEGPLVGSSEGRPMECVTWRGSLGLVHSRGQVRGSCGGVPLRDPLEGCPGGSPLEEIPSRVSMSRSRLESPL